MNVNATRKNTGFEAPIKSENEIFEARTKIARKIIQNESCKKFFAGNTAEIIKISENNFALGSSL